MLRTWAVKLPAMKLTLSVKSFLPTPLTAWTQRFRAPHGLPVLLPGKRVQLIHHDVTVFFRARISLSTVIFLERSPLATAGNFSNNTLGSQVHLPLS